MVAQCLEYFIPEIRIKQIRSGKVHCDIHIKAPAMPRRHLPDGRAECPAGQAARATGLFGDGDELTG